MIGSTALLFATAVALFATRGRLGLLWSAAGFFLATGLYVGFGFDPPVPRSVVVQYLATAALAMALYLSSSAAGLSEVWAPIRGVIVEPRRRLVLRAALLLGPLGVAAGLLALVTPSAAAPLRARSAHPAPPTEITFRGRTLALGTLTNPLRALEHSDPAAYSAALLRGRTVYYENCFFCHGDLLAGDGLFARALAPPPANFQDPGVLAMLPESFLFWRIAKGGPGLPNEGAPGDSAMPAWESLLPEEDVWAVVAFLYDYTGYAPRGGATRPPGKDLSSGAKVYASHCAQCHGETGAAEGPAAAFVLPRPQHFKGNSSFKLRSTASGELPTPEDQLTVVTRGIPGTAMPAFSTLSAQQRRDAVAFIRSLAPEFSDPAYQQGAVPLPELALPPPPERPETIERGRKLFDSLGCIKCHGRAGRGNGPSWKEQRNERGEPVLPRNLAHFDRFRRGSERADIFATLTTGFDGTPMASFADAVSVEDRWALADYVHSLRPALDPAQGDRILARRVEQLPVSGTDLAWAKVAAARLALFPNLIQPPRLYWPAVEFVSVQAVYTPEALALRVQWDDRTRATGSDLSEPYGDRDGKLYTETEHPDQLALQFPARAADWEQRPSFLFGDSRRPVNLWWWRSSVEGLVEHDARGYAALSRQPAGSQALSGEVRWDDGRYTLFVTRALGTDEGRAEVQFAPGAAVPISFHAWDGSRGEVGLRRALTGWSWLVLEPRPRATRLLAPSAGFFFTLAILLVVVRRVRQKGP